MIRRSSLAAALTLAAMMSLPTGLACFGQTAAPAENSPRVLVIPFTTLNVPDNQQWIATAVQENVIADLGRGREYSPVAFQGQIVVEDNATAISLAHKANADFAVRGAAQMVEKNVRLTAQLIDARTGNTIGTASATGPTTDLLKLEDQLSAQLRNTATATASAQPVPMPQAPYYAPPVQPQYTPGYSPVYYSPTYYSPTYIDDSGYGYGYGYSTPVYYTTPFFFGGFINSCGPRGHFRGGDHGHDGFRGGFHGGGFYGGRPGRGGILGHPGGFIGGSRSGVTLTGGFRGGSFGGGHIGGSFGSGFGGGHGRIGGSFGGGHIGGGFHGGGSFAGGGHMGGGFGGGHR